jgi:hypothetical protein
MNFTQSDFYCPLCGNKGIPLARKRSKQREKHHLKVLYCWHCRVEVNHIECRNEEEVKEFKENFENGVYADVVPCDRMSSEWKNYLFSNGNVSKSCSCV